MDMDSWDGDIWEWILKVFMPSLVIIVKRQTNVVFI